MYIAMHFKSCCMSHKQIVPSLFPHPPILLYEVPRIVKFVQSERTLVDARGQQGWGEGEGGTWCLMGTEFSLGR